MKELDHWHPVLLSERLKDAPVRVELHGRPIAVFRTGHGDVGALIDRCPHRGMLLSKGHVQDARLVCPYHGWTYDKRGNGFTSATPAVSVCAEHFEAVERFGAIWVRRPGAKTELPQLFERGFLPIGTMMHSVNQPMELVLDNFVEVEHTATTHWLLGYASESMDSVETKVDADERSVRVFNRGKQKRIPKALMKLFDIHEGDDFIDDWTTYFSPVYAVYTQYWVSPTDVRRRDTLKTAAFVVPRAEDRTDIVSFFSVNDVRRPLPLLLAKHVVRFIADQEIRRDQRMLEQLAPETTTSLAGLRLGRFDAVLSKNRKRIDQIYRGIT